MYFNFYNMFTEHKKKTRWVKRIFIIGALFLVIGVLVAWFIFTDTFDDTNKQKANIEINALDLIKQFETSDSSANKKFTEKIILVRGRVSETEIVDSIINIKMIDTTTNGTILFAFQQQNINDTKSLKVGDSIAIKGSCSGGVYSEILETEIINFKRCLVIK